MRIVHTSDWHAGRIWKGVQRLTELETVLGGLADFVDREEVDLVVVSGDVFDTGTPTAEAERAVFRVLRRIGEAGAWSVVIAGNHDNPSRIDAWGMLAEFANVHAVGRPRSAADGGVARIPSRTGDEEAVVAAVPFAAPRWLVRATQLAEGETQARQTYDEGLRRLVGSLCQEFRPDAVNLLTAHAHVAGAAWTGSERRVHLVHEWMASPDLFPETAHYVALGHIHRPQEVASPTRAAYAGSPLQLDFGEAGEEKSFALVEASAGRPAKVERIPYEGARPLVDIRATLAELEADADRLRGAGWLRILVTGADSTIDVDRAVRAMLPNAVSVDVDVERPAEPTTPRQATKTLETAAPSEVFSAYFEARHQKPPDADLMAGFQRLLDEESQA